MRYGRASSFTIWGSVINMGCQVHVKLTLRNYDCKILRFPVTIWYKNEVIFQELQNKWKVRFEKPFWSLMKCFVDGAIVGASNVDLMELALRLCVLQAQMYCNGRGGERVGSEKEQTVDGIEPGAPRCEPWSTTTVLPLRYKQALEFNQAFEHSKKGTDLGNLVEASEELVERLDQIRCRQLLRQWREVYYVRIENTRVNRKNRGKKWVMDIVKL
ncbi:hypothetical protein TSAR_003460 [Trichomalopsis sarcophagae]|uniref:Uncharacterized protein n=1 Tax=Trichomalopsis sarcophagae TaxID=543379 RepID=A0A232ERN9_9HYME|nr:hypothetical protein TSAR_003460 [Trichomalopsis sarcophagae]